MSCIVTPMPPAPNAPCMRALAPSYDSLCTAQLPWVCYCGVHSAMHPLAHLTAEPFLHRFDHTTPLWWVVVVLKRARLLCELVLCVSRAVLSIVLGAWSVRCVGWADWVDGRCFPSLVFLGDARRLELSPCNTSLYPPKPGLSSHVLCFTSRSPHTPAVLVVPTPTNHAQLSCLHHARP